MNTISEYKPITLDVLVKNKKYQPYGNYRTSAKAPNFSCLFGAKAAAFAGILIAKGFTEKDADVFINDLHLEDKVKQQREKAMRTGFGNSEIEIKYTVCADYMRTQFFNMYPGFMKRIARERAFAHDKGYVRDYNGPVRHLPELKYMSYASEPNSEGGRQLAKGDKSNYSRVYGGLMNDAVNTTIQSLEANVAFPTWYEVEQHLRQWKMKSFIWNNIHDSLDFCIYKPEAELLIALSNDCSAFERPPVFGIHMSFEPEVSDISDDEHRSSTYWKHGIETPTIKVEEALDRYNKKYGTNWEWDGCEKEFDYLLPSWYERHGLEVSAKPFSKVDLHSHNENDKIDDKEFSTSNGFTIKKEYCEEGGRRSYFLNCSDFNSLEARCAAQDTALNECGIDPVLLDLYKDGGSGDLHSTTAWSIYCNSVKRPYREVITDKGKTYCVTDQSVLKVLRDGKIIAVSGKDLLETDEIEDMLGAVGGPVIYTVEEATKYWKL